MKRGWYLRLWLAAIVTLAAAAPSRAQEFRGAITGTVTDSTGGVLPGVTVTIVNTDTRVEQHVVTDAKGVFPAL